MAERELGVVKAEQVENGGVQVVHMDRILLGFESKIIRGSVNGAGLYATARHPVREPVVVVIPSIGVARIRSWGRQLDCGRSPKLSTPDHQGLVQHSALLEVGQQGSNRLITFMS